MTEEEAKTKWCPHVRFYGTNAWQKMHAAGNRFGSEDHIIENPSSCHCIGSACMMWRNEIVTNANGESGGNGHGYCGLAGKQ